MRRLLDSIKIFDEIIKNTKYSNYPKIIFIESDQHFFYFASMSAKGKKLNNYLGYGNEDVFKEVGRAIAEIHNYHIYTDFGNVALKTYKIDAKVAKFCQEARLSQCCLLKDDVINFASNLQNLTYVHGDLNLDNIFIDLSLQKPVTFIDIDSLSEDIQNKQPVGIPAYEVQQFLSSLRLSMHESGADNNLYHAYSNAFLSGYAEVIKPKLFSSANNEFFSNYWFCRSNYEFRK